MKNLVLTVAEQPKFSLSPTFEMSEPSRTRFLNRSGSEPWETIARAELELYICVKDEILHVEVGIKVQRL